MWLVDQNCCASGSTGSDYKRNSADCKPRCSATHHHMPTCPTCARTWSFCIVSLLQIRTAHQKLPKAVGFNILGAEANISVLEKCLSYRRSIKSLVRSASADVTDVATHGEAESYKSVRFRFLDILNGSQLMFLVLVDNLISFPTCSKMIQWFPEILSMPSPSCSMQKGSVYVSSSRLVLVTWRTWNKKQEREREMSVYSKKKKEI